MSQKNSTLYFVDAYSPNAGESDLFLEYGILRWSENKSERPEVYVHTYLQPVSNNSRIRWSQAYAEMKISSDFLESKGDLPSIEDMIEADYLKGRNVVCFDLAEEPYFMLVRNSSTVSSIVTCWNEIFADDEKALSCETLDEMCDFIGILKDDNANTNYTPLLKKLHKMAALWSFIEEILKNPKRKKAIYQGGIQFNLIWPLPKTEEQWFENNPHSFRDLSDSDIKNFFSGNIADRLNWFEMNMYACDWVYNRQKRPTARELAGQKELAAFIFKKILSFKMQIWVLIFYSQFMHRKEDALAIACNRGNLSALRPAAIESFTNFIIDNLDVFLSPDQKSNLISSLINQSLRESDNIPFEHYDYDNLKKQAKRDPDGPRLYFTSNSAEGNAPECYKEIRDATGRTIYRRYEVKGRGKERDLNVEIVNHQLSMLLRDATNPFSDIWLKPPLKLWIQYITGINFTDITRVHKINDSNALNSARATLKKIIEKEALGYLKDLYAKLQECALAINQTSSEIEPICFNFQGISIEVVVIPASKMSFFKKLFTFE